jgi:hypothetical protein
VSSGLIGGIGFWLASRRPSVEPVALIAGRKRQGIKVVADAEAIGNSSTAASFYLRFNDRRIAALSVMELQADDPRTIVGDKELICPLPSREWRLG